MENHDNHGNSHNDDHGHAEPKGQTYNKSWWMPVVGLTVIALGFGIIGYFGFDISGTDKWGKTEQCENHEGKCCEGEESCKEGDKECKDKGACKEEGAMKEEAATSNDSVAAKTVETSKDSVATPAEHK